MKIIGIQKLSLVDYDGKISSTIFLSGCNFACPFCHNSRVVKSLDPEIPESEILDYLDKRKNLLEAVVISGGEPTLYRDLPNLITNIKKLGYLIKLDTNGTNPDMIKTLYENNLIDYIAMDIKNSLDNYNCITGSLVDIDKIQTSIDYIMKCGIDYEFRTTLVKEFHEEKDIIKIGKTIKNAKRYYLQKFEDSGECLKDNLLAIDKTIALQFKEILEKTIPHVNLRGY